MFNLLIDLPVLVNPKKTKNNPEGNGFNKTAR
jgi:hypothetical protein